MYELTTEQLTDIIDWATDCLQSAARLDGYEEFRASPARAVRYVEQHYPGGVPAFLVEARKATPAEAQRTFTHAAFHPNTLEYYAATLEADQADRDFKSAFDALVESGARAGSPQDYAVWHAGHYADAAWSLVRDLPVWRSQA